MKLRKVLVSGIAALMIAGSSFSAMAGQWMSYGSAWYYIQDNGQFATNKWVGNYYLGSNGVMLTNTWTPDGYFVGADGKWIPNAASADVNNSLSLIGVYQWTYTKSAGGAVSYATYTDTRSVSVNNDKSLTVIQQTNGQGNAVSQVSFRGTNQYVSVINNLEYTFPGNGELIIRSTDGTEMHYAKIA
ncbi:hypothetical protein [Oribacterium sp. WCC10]|uniref:hypothetical protein n=1 Tax=Oribacterium sp. WCC10 TaxID=1855343 RepID=UPI0008E6BA55|nr:hypothetical protein [Oribacterium sp. WCC10]SFG30002.1 hypothetical protein SAMN05216356_10545 [Oribacterium sp. WCC10]